MIENITDYISTLLNIEENISLILYYFLLTLVIGILAFLANIIGKKLVLRGVKKVIIKTATTKDEVFYNRKVFHLIVHYLPIIVVNLSSPLYGQIIGDYIRKGLILITIIITTLVIFRILDSINEIYMQRDFAKGMPIKGILQVVKIVVIFFAIFIVFISVSNTGSAMALLGSLGGMSAVIMLIFKDSILGFVAGIQLSLNNLLKIGDWIEMPNYQADGEVIDISLTKISVRNWNKTISHIPAYKFIEESFVNWDNMSQSGGRRIKRNLLIDINSIDFLTVEQIEKLKSIDILEEYLNEKTHEIENYNDKKPNTHSISNRKLTNIGTFRVYIEKYLRNHASIKQDETLIVRQLEASGNGMPMQIYCFANDTRWANYEGIQSDIFDHLYAIIDDFELLPYQEPTGVDIAGIRFNQ